MTLWPIGHGSFAALRMTTLTIQTVRLYVPLLGVAALAAALRWFRIDAQSLWYDEGISAHQLTRSFPEILRAAALDTHPPLYYWALKAWSEVFGQSELALRSLSALCGLAAVVLTFLIGRRLFGPLAGLLGALLLAVAPLAVYYSQEVRMYAMVSALGLLAVYAHTRRKFVLYAIAGLATLYTQYLGIAVLLALNLHAALFLTRSRGTWLRWGAANAAIAIGFLPWLPTFVDQQSHALNVSPRTAIGLTTRTLTAYGGGIAQSEVFLWGGVLLVVLAAVGVAIYRQWDALTLALLNWLVPLGLVIGLGLRSGLFEVRYLVLGLPGLCLLAGLGMTKLVPKPLVMAPLGLAVAPAAMGLSAQYFDPALARDDYRGLVAAIQRDARPNDAIVLVAPNQVEVFGYYYTGPLPMVGLPAQRPIDPDDAVRRLEAIRSAHERIWLVSWAMVEADPKGVIASWFADKGFQATHNWYGSVQLALVGFGSPPSRTVGLDAELDNGIVLDGYRIGTLTLRPGETLDLTLVWKAAHGPTADRWKVFTHLLDSGSIVVAQRDAEPLDNLKPTTSWERGETIQDNYGISIPPTLPAGSYTLEIGMYDGDTRSIIAGYGDHLVLGTVQVLPPDGST